MRRILDSFNFVPNGTTTLADALYDFIKEEIAFGRIKGGERFPTMAELSKATGLTFAQTRRIMESLVKEGYLLSRPHSGTVVLARGENVLRGRVLFILPDVDVCRYHPCQLLDMICRRFTSAGYAFSISTFPLDANADLTHLKSELVRAIDLVIATRATPQVQKCLVESGVNHIFAYGDCPELSDSLWIRFSPEEALMHFAEHCARAGIHHVVQVRFEDNETLDASPALAKKGIECSWLVISRNRTGKARFDGVMRYACEIFKALPRSRIPDLLLFWNAFVAQGAVTAFLSRGIRIPEDVKAVSLFETGFGPVYSKPFTRIEIDPIAEGTKIADFALAVLAKRRIHSPPKITPQYVFGDTFPF